MAFADETIERVDRALFDCSREIRLFFHVAPANEAEERVRFFTARGREWLPDFTYRPLEFDAEAMRRALDRAPVEAIEDEILNRLYADKRWELERIFRYWASGADMEHLLLGKVTMESLDDVRGLVERGVLRRAAYLPEYLDQISDHRPAVQEQLGLDRVPLAGLLSLNLA